ncbi:unnamed protein product [Calypogeia fissa]
MIGIAPKENSLQELCTQNASRFQKHTTQLGTLGDLTIMMGGSGSLFTFGRSLHQQTRLPLQLFWARM